MARLSAEEYATKHANRLKAATEDMRQGIRRVSQAPGAEAVKHAEKLKTNFVKSVDDGTWARKTGEVSLDEWQTAAAGKGVDRVAAGIDAAHDRQVQMAARLLSVVDSAASKVETMPSTTLDDNINRMTTFVREMAKSRGKI